MPYGETYGGIIQVKTFKATDARTAEFIFSWGKAQDAKEAYAFAAIAVKASGVERAEVWVHRAAGKGSTKCEKVYYAKT